MQRRWDGTPFTLLACSGEFETVRRVCPSMQLGHMIDGLYGSANRRLERMRLGRRFDLPPEWWIYGPEQPMLQGQRSDEPSPWGVLGRIIRADEIDADDVFIDVGCGRGQVLLEAAANYAVRRVVGVDLDAGLCELGRRTLEANRAQLRCQHFELVATDAGQYPLPDDVTIVYLCNPFGGSTFEQLLGNVFASFDRSPRRLRIVYFLPAEAARLEASGRARLVRRGSCGIRRWAEADYLRMYEVLAEPKLA